MWREMMMYDLERVRAANPSERIERSEALLKTLRDQWSWKASLRFHSTLVDLEIASIRSGGGNWFFHDDLATFFELFSISDFSRELESRGLQFASEALFENLIPEALPVWPPPIGSPANRPGTTSCFVDSARPSSAMGTARSGVHRN